MQSWRVGGVQATKKLTLAVMNSIKVLAKVEEASLVHLLLPPEAFYNQLISDKMDMQARRALPPGCTAQCVAARHAQDRQARGAVRSLLWAVLLQLHPAARNAPDHVAWHVRRVTEPVMVLRPALASRCCASAVQALIASALGVQDHYLAWRQSHNNDHRSPAGMGPFSFCSFPFLLNAKAKTRLLQVCRGALRPATGPHACHVLLCASLSSAGSMLHGRPRKRVMRRWLSRALT